MRKLKFCNEHLIIFARIFRKIVQIKWQEESNKSLMKRWLMETYQGAVRKQHLDYYLDEYTFRFNRRTSTSRGKLFYRLVQQAMMVDPVPANQIVGGTGTPQGVSEAGDKT